jgi:riboflavin kinase / FMN adenylyltransferase
MDERFRLSGIVTPSKQRGRRLGFPTANLNLDPGPHEDGVYLAQATCQGKWQPALLFIGPAVTFDETERKVEVYLLVRCAPAYGEYMEVEAIKKLRENRKFGSADELIVQMQDDEKRARQFFVGA